MIKMLDNLYFIYENDMDFYFYLYLIEEISYCNVFFLWFSGLCYLVKG